MMKHDGNDDNVDLLRMLTRSQAGPSAAHDRTVLGAADRLLEPPRQSPPRNWQIPAALGATVLLAVSLTLSGILPPDPPVPDPAVRAGLPLSVPQTGAQLDALPARLSWPAVPGATGYRVVLRDAAADIVWSSSWLDEPQLVLAGDAAAHLAGLDTCIWSVDVSGAATTLEVGPFWFHLATR